MLLIDADRLIETLELRLSNRYVSSGYRLGMRELIAEIKAGAFAPVSRAVTPEAFGEALSAALADGTAFDDLDDQEMPRSAL